MNKYAIVVDPHDNVAVVKKEVPPGTMVMLDGGHSVSVKTTVPIGNRFAIRAIPAGDFVCQYGQPIGTSLGISDGLIWSRRDWLVTC